MSTLNERSVFIEETGIFFESMGLTRMAGRILGLLMVTDKEMVSFDELTQVLQASKSSISTNVKALIQTRFVKPVTSPGDRKTYYMLSQEISWQEIFNKKARELDFLKSIFDKALSLRTNKNDKSSQWLIDAVEFYGWLMQQFPLLMEKWEKYKTDKTT